MKHKPQILLIGFQKSLNIELLSQITIVKCKTIEKAIELIETNQFDLIISKYQNQDTLAWQQLTASLKSCDINRNAKKIKLLILTSKPEEDKACKENNLLYYPENLELKQLVRKLITLPLTPPSMLEKEPILINFKELFIRVDNKREFIQSVIQKFFKVEDSRIDDIRTPLLRKEYKQAKNAAHKLKGVLANFSMEQARLTIVELENLISDIDHELSIKKLDQLVKDLKRTREYYNDNLDQFQN